MDEIKVFFTTLKVKHGECILSGCVKTIRIRIPYFYFYLFFGDINSDVYGEVKKNRGLPL
jgi:hypothetical protein